ncbi:MAG: hypothetical protein JO250_23510 [Armatimonadetes bacterium]|nr:hypothetical protein [Armatimonadota bacterium]
MSEPSQGEGGQAYQILEGVRRAKAAWLFGRKTIAAKINGVGDVVQVPVERLLSTKDEIETHGVRGLDWGRVYRGTRDNVSLPPIEITPSTQGIPIQDVVVEEENLDVFRQRA